MLKFLTSAILVTALCSLIKFTLNLGLMRYINPGEFATYAIVVIFWGFVEIFAERGTQALTIKNGINNEKIMTYLFEYAQKILITMAFIIILCMMSNHLNLLEVDFGEIFLFCVIGLGTMIKLAVLLFESQSISEGKYIQKQLTELLSVIIVYFLAIVTMHKMPIGGNSILAIVFLAQPSIYILFYYKQIYSLSRLFVHKLKLPSRIRKTNFSDNLQDEDFKKNVVKSASYEYISTKIDELTAFFIFSGNIFGTYLKFKDLAATIAGFGSRVISRPWFYVCVKYSKDELVKVLLSILFITFLAIFVGLAIPSDYFERFVIILLTSKWESLAIHSKKLYLFACFMFLYIFLKYTISGVGAQAKQTLIDTRILIISLLVLSLILVSKFCFGMALPLDVMIYTLFLIKIYGVIAQLILLKTVIK
jgi:hypothetical protein